jgi:hypothetical protein
VAFDFGYRFGEEGDREGASKVRSVREDTEEIDDDRIRLSLEKAPS